MNIGDWVVFKTFRRQKDPSARFGHSLVHQGWTYPARITDVRAGHVNKDITYVDAIMIGQEDSIKSDKIENARLATADDFKVQAEDLLEQSKELTDIYYAEKDRINNMYSAVTKEIENAKRDNPNN